MLHDLTVPIRHGMTVYPGDPTVNIERVASLAAGDICNLSRLDFGVHSGTHVDAPLHFIDGAPGVEGLPLEALLGPVTIVDATAVSGVIDMPALERLRIPAGATRLLFKTANSRLWDASQFTADFIGIADDAAGALVQLGVRLVGIDYLSIAPPGAPTPTHLTLLGAGVVVLEALDLRRVNPGDYRLYCLPTLIPGSDGAPTRVVVES